MDLSKFAGALDTFLLEGVDLTDLHVIALYQRAKGKGDVTIMALTKSGHISPTVMQRRIKKLIRMGVLVKTEHETDQRIRPLADGKLMKSIVSLFNPV